MARPRSAQNNPVSFGAQETYTGDMPMSQKDDIDISLGKHVERTESFANVTGAALEGNYASQLAFNEEPITIRIEPNPRQSEAPETHVPVVVQGKGAEVFVDGKWTELTWLPIGIILTTKRKFVEVIARARTDHIKTHHEEANVERPRNAVHRSTVQNYPVSVMQDKNPLGAEWLSRIMMSH